MKKYIVILFLVVLIAPSTVLASWWNPLSWKIFQKKNITPQVQVEEQKNPEEKINELQKQFDESNNMQVLPSSPESISEITNEVRIVDNSVKIKTETPAKAPTTVPTPISNPENLSSLKFTNVKRKVIGNSVTVTWVTNVPTESTLVIPGYGGGVYASKNGFSTNHSVTIDDLTQTGYGFELTANRKDGITTGRNNWYYGSFYLIEKFEARLIEFDKNKCQKISLMDSNGLLTNKQVSVGLSSNRGKIISYGEIKLITNSDGQIKYCDNPSVNQFRIEYLGHTVILERQFDND